jgi:hypothetical protein
MTAQLQPHLSKDTTGQAAPVHNPFTVSLAIGFFLSPDERAKAAEVLRDAIVSTRKEVVVPPKALPNIPKGTPKEVADEARAVADAANAVRRAKIQEFFAELLGGHPLAERLAQTVRSTVTSFVARETEGDALWTLITEHD